MNIRTEPAFVRRRRVAVACAVALAVLSTTVACDRAREDSPPAAGGVTSPTKTPTAPTKTPTASATATPAPTASPTSTQSPTPKPAGDQPVSLPPADTTDFTRLDRLTGRMSPKSVVAGPGGIITAQNMMYTHTISVFDPSGKLIKTIPDSVELADFGIKGHPGTSQGAPVEAAFTHDGKYVYVSNYSMYGQNFGPEGSDSCTPASQPDKSFLYRIDTATLKIDQVIPVGSVPKYVAVTPDDKTVLVTNWCSWDLSVVDVASAKVRKTIPLNGSYPRGIAVAPDSRTAFVAMMGSTRVDKVDLSAGKISGFAEPGSGPRHLVISPDGKYLYSTNNGSGTVSKIDASSGRVIKSVFTGSQPRSMAISSDGKAVYVVNYESSTVSKLRTSDMTEIAEEPTDHHPIGITYEPKNGTVWVACYAGSIIVFDDSKAS
jgi:YVTN family beta-propeller protein